MNNWRKKLLFFVFIFASSAFATEMGIPVQLRLQQPDSTYPTASGLTFKIQILSPTGGCILREETFSGQTITNGNISLALGTGTRGTNDPNIVLNSVYDNTTVKSNLTCVDSSDNVTSTGQSYTPVFTDVRILRVVTTISPDTIIADFNQRSVPYAIQAESVGGKLAADILVQNAATALNESNLTDLLLDGTHFTNLKNIALNGQAATATTATTATNFSGSLGGDVTGNQAATTVTGLRGVSISATAPTTGQVLTYDGSQYIPTTPAGGASVTVTSVNGKTGAVSLTASDIPGVLTSSTTLAGDVTGLTSATTVAKVGGKTAAQVSTAVDSVNSATANATANTIAKRDGSGNLSANSIAATSVATQGLYVYDNSNIKNILIKAPLAFSNFTLTLPASTGTNGQFLQTDGSGVLTWATASGSSVTSASVISALGYTPANVATSLQNSTVFGGDVSGTYNAIVLNNSGVTSGTYQKVSVDAKGRVTSGALLSNADVVTALGYTPANSATAASVTSSSVVTALGYTPADSATVVLKSNNLSDLASATVARTNLGLGGAAVLNIGTVANTVAAGNDARITNAIQNSTIFGGDVSGTYNSIVLNNSGVTSGTYQKVSVDAKGRVTSGALLSNADVVTALGYTPANSATAVTSGSVVAALGYTPADSATVVLKSNNLSDLASATVARTNLGLGGAAVLNIGTVANTVAAGNDARIANAIQNSTIFGGDVSGTYNSILLNNSGVTSGTYIKVSVDAKGRVTSGGSLLSSDIVTALGYTPANSATTVVTSGSVVAALGYTPADSATVVLKSNNLSDLASATVARTNLGLGGAAVLNIGTTANTVAAGNDARIANALQLTTVFGGDVSGTYNAIVLNNSGVTSGTYIKVSVDAKGRVTSGASLLSSDIVTALGYTPANSSTAVTSASVISALGYTPANVATSLQNSTVFGGDVSGTYNAIVLNNSGVTSGTYQKVSVDTKGRVTSGASLSNADIVAALGYTPSNSATSVTSSSITTALGYTPANSSTVVLKANNLSDIASATVARANLGLGGAAILNVGTITGTVMAGDDARVTGALSQSGFNTYVASASCSNSQSMYWNSVSSVFACQNINLSGDVTGNASATTVAKIQGVGVSFTSLAANNILQYNGTKLVNQTIPTCSGGQYLTFNGTTWSCANDVVGGNGTVTNVSSANSYLSVATSSTTPVLTLNVGTVANTVAAGNDARITNALQTTTVFGGDVSGTYNAITLNNSGVTAATYTKFTVDAKGRVTSGASLLASDVPSLDASKITTGQLPISLGGTGAATSAAALTNLGAAANGANADITSLANAITFSAAGTALTVTNNASIGGSLSVSGSVTVAGNVTVSGAVSGTARASVLQKGPTAGGSSTAFTISYGAAVDATIASYTIGDNVKFRPSVSNTATATLQVGSGPAVTMLSAFTGVALNANDLIPTQVYEANYNGTNWMVSIPQRRFTKAGLNLSSGAITQITAVGVNLGDVATCTYTTASAYSASTNTTNVWVASAQTVSGIINVLTEVPFGGGPPNITSFTCSVQK